MKQQSNFGEFKKFLSDNIPKNINKENKNTDLIELSYAFKTYNTKYKKPPESGTLLFVNVYCYELIYWPINYLKLKFIN